jgi:hypothetical protein
MKKKIIVQMQYFYIKKKLKLIFQIYNEFGRKKKPRGPLQFFQKKMNNIHFFSFIYKHFLAI